MQINDVNSQILKLTKNYLKSQDNLFSAHMKNQEKSKSIDETLNNSKSFYIDQKKLKDRYEAEKYKLEISDKRTIYTAVSTINMHQSFMIDVIKNEIDKEYKILNDKLSSGKYNFFQKIELKKEFKKFKDDMEQKLFNDTSSFSSRYFESISKKETNQAKSIEDGLLSNLLARL